MKTQILDIAKKVISQESMSGLGMSSGAIKPDEESAGSASGGL